jgi:hypothetical protein
VTPLDFLEPPGLHPLTLVFAGLCAGLLIWLIVKGPTRGVKIALLVLLAGFLGAQAGRAGVDRALLFLGVIVGVNLVFMTLTALLLRHPARSSLGPVGEGEEWPAYARRSLQRFTDELLALGFRVHGDRRSSWRIGSQEKQSFIRFFSHPSPPCWAEIHALAPSHRFDPTKLVARALRSVGADGATLTTCDRQANEEFFRDPLTRVQRVAASTSCRDMLAAHERRAPTDATPVDDPPALHARLYDAWVDRVVASGQVRVRGDQLVIPPALVLPVALRVWGAWLQ